MRFLPLQYTAPNLIIVFTIDRGDKIRQSNALVINKQQGVPKVKKALAPVGLKRICTSCGVRFYDLNKRPINCPSCSTEFTGDIKLKSRRGRLSAEVRKEEVQKAPVEVQSDDEIIVGDEEIEIVSLEDVEQDVDDDDDDAMKLEDDNLADLDAFEDDDLDEDIKTEDVAEDEE